MSTAAKPDTRWKEAKLGDICTIVRGASPRPKGDPRYFGGRIPWISIADVTAAQGKYLSKTKEGVTREGAKKSRLDLTDMKFIDLNAQERGKYLVSDRELLFNRTNSADLVGKTAVFRGTSPMAFAGYLIRPRPNEQADSEYIAGVLNSEYGKKKLKAMCKSIIGMANINAKEVQAIEIPKPPIVLQRRYAQSVCDIEHLRNKQQASLTKLDTLFASLQHRAFRGEL